MSCLVCSPNSCRASWVYVAHDLTLGLVKIGKTVSPSRRFIQYRKELKRDIRRLDAWQIGCDFEITSYEGAALALLPAERRVWGDWYDVDPEMAIRAVRQVLPMGGV